MNKEAIKNQILEALTKRLGDDFHISSKKVFKANLELDGLVIMEKDENICPTIYLEDYYEELENGTDINDVCGEILYDYYHAKLQMGCFDLERLEDFNHIKDRLFVQLVNKHLNEEMLQNVPHTMYLDDFAIVARCNVDSGDNKASFLVDNTLLSTWQVDRETLISIAIRNMQDAQDVELMPLGQLIREWFPDCSTDKLSDEMMWIMTNRRRCYGAATVLLDDMLKDFAKEHGNFCIIFSSVHEALLLPRYDVSDIERLTEMNLAVNESQVEEYEVLGTKAYFYDKDKGFVL